MVTGTGNAVTGLGGSAGYGETDLARSDDGSARQDWSSIFQAGLNWFGTTWAATDIFVNTNGTITFGAAQPDLPTAANAAWRGEMIGAFWADIDTRLRGEGLESGPVTVDLDAARDAVTVTWDNVGAYRRNTESVNRFQVQLFDKGNGDFDLALRYEAINWTMGSAETDTGARALLDSLRMLDPVALLPGSDLAALDATRGNTGVAGLWVYQMRAGKVAGIVSAPGLVRDGTAVADVLEGGANADLLRGREGNDVLRGQAGNDTLYGNDGADTLNGGEGDDSIIGGGTEADLRDVIYAGPGNDRVDGGYGNDLVYGDIGDDTIEGGFGADELIGQAGNDALSGGPLADQLFGGEGNDYLNGGFGNDRLNGGAGADRFYHLGIADHGSDWVQDYSSLDGDRLQFGGSAAATQFQVNYALTAGTGQEGVAEAFVLYRPTGQIVWALVDGAAQSSITLQIGSQLFDLLA